MQSCPSLAPASLPGTLYVLHLHTNIVTWDPSGPMLCIVDSNFNQLSLRNTTTSDTMPQTTNDGLHGLWQSAHLALSASPALAALLAQLLSSPPSEGALITLGLTGHLPEAPDARPLSTSTSISLGLTSTARSTLPSPPAHRDVEIVHSTFLRQINGLIPRMLQTSFLETRVHRGESF